MPGQRFGDLPLCEMTVLNQLKDRRDSTTSTVSSAYTLSRRSSGISPCYSSRRSSEASQFGGRNNNISSADSYDPISIDLSRRSSEASQCGGSALPSLLSLTPAQHYRLKAKYAAATGGAPPTPLPNMDRMSLRTRMALYNDSQENSAHLFQARNIPISRRCSDMSYGVHGMMPHEIPSNMPRRASDPVRRTTMDPHSLPRVQRYNSMSSMNPSRVTLGDHHGVNLQNNTFSDGSLHRHAFNQRPPSISENVVIENMAMDEADQTEEDIVLPDDVVQYLRSQHAGSTQDDMAYNGGQPQVFRSNQNSQQHQQFCGQRRMALVDGNMNDIEQIMPPCQISPGSQQPFPASDSVNKNHMPVQWNEVSSGTVDNSARFQKQQHLRGNLALVQQKQNSGPYQSFGSNPQSTPINQNLAVSNQGYLQRNFQRTNPNQYYRQLYVNPCQNLNEQTKVHPGYKQEMNHNLSSGNIYHGPVRNSMALQNQEMQSYKSGYSRLENQHNYISLTQTALQNGGRVFQPRPPPEPKPSNGHHTGSGLPHQAGYSLSSTSSDFNTSEASPKRPAATIHSSSGDNTVCYSRDKIVDSNIDYNSPMSPSASQTKYTTVATMASPGINQVTSTVDSTQTAEHAQIDFDTMLDDGDHSSLMSGTLSPGLLQSLSQNSSRLTTPRNSVTLASVPAGISNMAIGDMSSMLTALAEESKFLNLMV